MKKLRLFVFTTLAVCAAAVAYAAPTHRLIALLALLGFAAVLALMSVRRIKTQQLGAVALIALVMIVPFGAGCSGKSVAQDIVNWTPTLQSTAATVDSVVAGLDPADKPILAAALVGFDAVSNEVVAQAQAYLASPNTSTLGKLQNAVVTLQSTVSSAALAAVRIVNPNSQQAVKTALQAVETVVTAIVALVGSISKSSAAVVVGLQKQQAASISWALRSLDRYQATELIAAHYGAPRIVTRERLDHVLDSEIAALMPIPLCAPGLPCTPPPCPTGAFC